MRSFFVNGRECHFSPRRHGDTEKGKDTERVAREWRESRHEYDKAKAITESSVSLLSPS